MVATVFIDGESGTSGLQIHARLRARSDLRLLTISPEQRKDLGARRALLNAADAVILCLPDEAARESVALIENPSTRVIDASTAHRTAPGWTYGFPEMAPGQTAAIAGARRVTNPGCYPTGFIALVRPLVDAGIVPASWPVSVSAVSGYSGGGRAMIAEFEDESSPDFTSTPFRPYALNGQHKHVPEMRLHAGLEHEPLFAPAVGRFRQGMVVEVPLPLHALPLAPHLSDIQDALETRYAGAGQVEVASMQDAQATRTLDPELMNGTDRMRLFVCGSDAAGHGRLVAVLDNLGKGAAGAAVRNLELMLGLGLPSG